MYMKLYKMQHVPKISNHHIKLLMNKVQALATRNSDNTCICSECMLIDIGFKECEQSGDL